MDGGTVIERPRKKLLINTKRSAAEREVQQPGSPTADLDAYMTDPRAVEALLACERDYIPHVLWEPGAGTGNVVSVLREAGHVCYASDIYDGYGFPLDHGVGDYLKTSPPAGLQGIVTNPPYNLAQEFADKAISEAGYVAFLLRTNFLESTKRMSFFERLPPARIWIASRRLPAMHAWGWTGKKVSTNQCFMWIVWDLEAEGRGDLGRVGLFDWKTGKHFLLDDIGRL